MSLVYIVDGYNAIKRSSFFKDKRLREARDSFLSYLERHGLQGSPKNRVVVVFDGSKDVEDFFNPHACEVVFTKGPSADDQIKRFVAESRNPKNVVVVTDDKELASSVRRCLAKTMGTQEFLRKRPLEKKKDAGGGPEPKAELNIVQREAITDELRRIWLDKRSS